MPDAVLGIDAAWTAHHPSGLALAERTASGWRLALAAASHAEFHAHCGAPPSATPADPGVILASAQAAVAARVAVIAVDMPLARGPITGRRVSDNRISAGYGARGAGTHTPSAQRPGPLSAALGDGFARQGYPLAVSDPVAGALIEVYPHPALIELMGASYRLPYKQGNIGRYWAPLTPAERRLRLVSEWARIVAALDDRIAGVAEALPLPSPAAPIRDLKGFEDRLDAVVCAWVGICALEGRAIAHGDAVSAIWVPAAPGA